MQGQLENPWEGGRTHLLGFHLSEEIKCEREHDNFLPGCHCSGTGVAGMEACLCSRIYGRVVSSMKHMEFGSDTSQPLHYMSVALCIFAIILMNNVSYCFQMGETLRRS